MRTYTRNKCCYCICVSTLYFQPTLSRNSGEILPQAYTVLVLSRKYWAYIFYVVFGKVTLITSFLFWGDVTLAQSVLVVTGNMVNFIGCNCERC